MGTEQKVIMTVNAGSSSIKLDLFTTDFKPILNISATNIGQPHSKITVESNPEDKKVRHIRIAGYEEAAEALFVSINDELSSEHIVAIGHRVVHGGKTYFKPTKITDEVLVHLKQLPIFDPSHMHATIGVAEIFKHRFKDIPQVACFDTAFYNDLPLVAKLLPIPRKYEKLGLRRYGFHGLSYESLLSDFSLLAGENAAHGRIILAHLGSGASLTAVKNGKPIDTTMSFTPASGIPMSSRSGDLDPGVMAFLHRQSGMTIAEFNKMVNFESGLLGISGISADMEELIRESDKNQSAKEAVDVFCYQARKAIGSLSATLGGLDSLIFAGGMGENSPLIRARICDDLEYLGIVIDEHRNNNHEFLISRDQAQAGVHVMHTDEAKVIATHTYQLVKHTKKDKK